MRVSIVNKNENEVAPTSKTTGKKKEGKIRILHAGEDGMIISHNRSRKFFQHKGHSGAFQAGYWQAIMEIAGLADVVLEDREPTTTTESLLHFIRTVVEPIRPYDPAEARVVQSEIIDDRQKELLQALTDGPATAGELARNLDRNRSNSYRDLQALVGHGLVEKEADARYRLSVSALVLMTEVQAELDNKLSELGPHTREELEKDHDYTKGVADALIGLAELLDHPKLRRIYANSFFVDEK